MEIKDWITIFSVVVIVTGWFVNGHLNRKNELLRRDLSIDCQH